MFEKRFRAGDYDRDRGRLRSWLKGIALNKIREAWRGLARPEVQMVDKTDGTGFMNGVPDPNDDTLTNIFDEEWERGVMAECLAQVRRHFDVQTLRAFRLYVLDGCPAEKVADELGISRNAVYISKTRVLSRLTKLQEEITELW